MTATESMKDKIRKLLAKANDTSVGVEEAKAFNDKAFSLMQQYNLERSELGEAQQRDSVRGLFNLTVLKRPWSSMILHGVCRLYYCTWFFERSPGRGPDIVTIVGEESNAAICHAIAVMVLRAVQQEARTTGGGRSFMTGAALEIRRRCEDLVEGNKVSGPEQQAQLTSGQSTALVVLGENEERANAEHLLKITGGALRTARTSRAVIRDGNAFGQGQAFGKTVALRQNLLR